MQLRNAEVFASLHQAGAPLLLANAWDVASAVAIEAAGAKAIATTSAGVAWSLGVPDAAGLGAGRAAEVIARITAAVSVPVSADIEAGYGDSPDAVAATVRTVVQAGAVGVNLEDRREGASLFETAQQADRLAAARAAAGDVNAWINARTDVFLSGVYASTAAAVEAVLERAAAYRAAGANSLFIPGLVDLEVIAKLVAGPLPVAVMAWSGAPTVAQLTAVGVVRISLGSAIAEAAYGLAARATAELLTSGTYDTSAHGFGYTAMNDALSRRRTTDGRPGFPM
ncbi:MAG TPA: isocitrate lyase/phosphoenolpyruvate mutase family protein [Streptosporangiaceae bacterium]